MSAVDTTSFANILSGGVMGGWQLGQRDRQFQQESELENLRALARQANEDRHYQLELRDRLLLAEREAGRVQASRKLFKALEGANQPMGVGGMPDMPGMGGMGGAMGPFPRGSEPGAATPAAEPEALLGLTDEEFANLSPGEREMVTRSATNRGEAARKVQTLRETADHLRRTGNLSRAKPEFVQELMKTPGVLDGVREDELPPELRLGAVFEDEKARPALLDYLSMVDTPAGKDIDLDRRAQLQSLTTPELRAMQTRRIEAKTTAEEKVKASTQATKRLESQPFFRSLAPERQYVASEQVADGGAPTIDAVTNPRPQPDPTIDNRTAIREKKAEHAEKVAMMRYKALNEGKDTPPDDDTVKLVRRGKPERTWTSSDETDNANFRKAVAKVRAWEDVQRAQNAVGSTLDENERMFKAGGQQGEIRQLIQMLLGEPSEAQPRQ